MNNLKRVEQITRLFFLTICLCLIFSKTAFADDMREVSKKFEKEYKEAEENLQRNLQRIFNDKKLLLSSINGLNNEINGLNLKIKAQAQTIDSLNKKEKILTQTIEKQEGETVTLQDEIQSSLKSFRLLTARQGGDKSLLKETGFAGINEIKKLATLFFKEMKESSEVTFKKETFIDIKGKEQKSKILKIGNITALYKTEDDAGFLKYSEKSNKFIAISPDSSVQKNIKKYIEGKENAVFVDISNGKALESVIHKKSWKDRLKDGGFFVFPILLIAILSILIIIERFFFLQKIHENTDKIMSKVNQLAEEGKWDECNSLATSKKGRPVYNVLCAGLFARGEKRETLESVLEEAILKELPKLERYLPILNIMGTIAPLLGLLGTVTGMITTFHTITVYGTSDPKLMSGGISEALITTMLGLLVAIPIMLIGTFLNRRVDHIIGDMEEKAVALTNIIFKKNNGA